MSIRNELLEKILEKTIEGSSKGGFIDYNDTSTTASPLVLVADTWTTIPNDGLGAFTNKTYKPDGVTELMNTSTGALDATDLVLGSSILVRNDFSVTPNTNNSLLEFRYTLGDRSRSLYFRKAYRETR